MDATLPMFLHPTSSLPKFPHVPLRIGGRLLGYEERRCRTNCPCNYSKISSLWRTDKQTDERHAISIPRYALVHRAVATNCASVILWITPWNIGRL